MKGAAYLCRISLIVIYNSLQFIYGCLNLAVYPLLELFGWFLYAARVVFYGLWLCAHCCMFGIMEVVLCAAASREHKSLVGRRLRTSWS